MEAEHREILRQALKEPLAAPSFRELLLAMLEVGEDSDFDREPDHGREIPF
jgi:plasmid stability protein